MSLNKSKHHQCSYCEKMFSLQSQLIIHIRQHTGEKPFQCGYCQKGFASIKVLKVHERIHTGEKPYKCPYCEKCFAAYANLVVHKRIHTNEKPYQCQLCQRAFEHSGNLSRHFKAHLTENGLKCILCSRVFAQDFELLEHTKEDHENEHRSYIMSNSIHWPNSNASTSGIKYTLEQKTDQNDDLFPRDQSYEEEIKCICNSDQVTEFVECPQGCMNNDPNKHEGITLTTETDYENCTRIFSSRSNNYEYSPIRQPTHLSNSSLSHYGTEDDSLLNEPDVATACHQLKSMLKIGRNHKDESSELYSNSRSRIPFSKVTRKFSNDSFSKFKLPGRYLDPPPLIPITDIEESQHASNDNNSLSPESELLTNEELSLQAYPWHDVSNGCHTKLNEHSSPSSYEWQLNNDYSCDVMDEQPDNSTVKDFLMSEYNKFGFKRKVEKVMVLLLGKENLRKFGYPKRSCEQVLIRILDSMEESSCADVRVDEEERLKINVRVLIERNFQDDHSWKTSAWERMSTEHILDQIIHNHYLSEL